VADDSMDVVVASRRRSAATLSPSMLAGRAGRDLKPGAKSATAERW
jgi:hypothetical protein